MIAKKATITAIQASTMRKPITMRSLVSSCRTEKNTDSRTPSWKNPDSAVEASPSFTSRMPFAMNDTSRVARKMPMGQPKATGRQRRDRSNRNAIPSATIATKIMRRYASSANGSGMGSA